MSLLLYFINPAFAQVPGFLNPSTESSIPEFIKGFYDFALMVGGVLAVGAIVVGGIMYSISGAVDKKNSAKGIIAGALWGLLLLLGSYVILRTVNPELVNLEAPELPEAEFSQCTEEIVEISSGAQIKLPKCGLGEWPISFETGECKCYVDKTWVIEHNIIFTEEDEPQSPKGKFEGGSVPSVNGSCFPVERSSFDYISWNWGDNRIKNKTGIQGSRCHAGIDIYTKPPGMIVAIAPGKVVNIQHFYVCGVKNRGAWGWHGGDTNAIIIDHGDFTVIYGEVDVGGEKVKVGDAVKAGTVLGKFSNCGMLHFELYTKGITHNISWYPTKPMVGDNECAKRSLSTKPAELLDPNNTIKDLQSKICGN